MNFSNALELIKQNKRLARDGWDGSRMFVFLVQGSSFSVSRPPLLGIFDEGTIVNYLPHIDMKTSDGSITTWVASQSDLLSDDWREI